MTVSVTVVGSDVASAPTSLQMAIPGGFVASARADAYGFGRDAGGAIEPIQLRVAAAGTVINFERFAGAWTDTTSDNTNVVGQISFPVTL